MTKKEIIEKINPIFIEELDILTNIYKLISKSRGFSINCTDRNIYDESPMLLEYRGTNDEMDAIEFDSLLGNFGFKIQLSEEEIDTILKGGRSYLGDHFNKVKYEYLRDNYPTVFNEQSHSLPIINSFLESYV